VMNNNLFVMNNNLLSNKQLQIVQQGLIVVQLSA
jgi:hypothetical protein